jgi:hypothetical protein
MPDPRIKCGAGKSGMTNVKKKGFSKLLILAIKKPPGIPEGFRFYREIT